MRAVNATHQLFVPVRNPSGWPIAIFPLSATACEFQPLDPKDNRTSTSEAMVCQPPVFHWGLTDVSELVVLPPFGELNVGPVSFAPRELGTYRGELYLRSNLTRLSTIHLSGVGGKGFLSYRASRSCSTLAPFVPSGCDSVGDEVGSSLFDYVPTSRIGEQHLCDEIELHNSADLDDAVTTIRGGTARVVEGFIPFSFNLSAFGVLQSSDGRFFRFLHNGEVTFNATDIINALYSVEASVPFLLLNRLSVVRWRNLGC